jgi:two-component system, cell cycle sensor histidine kinase and response regulator CckA
MPFAPGLLHKQGPSSLDFWLAVADNLPDILILVDSGGTIIYINHLPKQFSVQQVIGTNVLDYGPDETRDELRRSIAAIFNGGPAGIRVVRGLLGHDTERWYSMHAGPVVIGSQTVAALIVARDVTEQQEANSRLAESEARYRVLVENAPEAIVVFDVDLNRFVDANQEACRLFDLTMEELLTTNPVALSPAVQRSGFASEAEARRLLTQAVNGINPQFEWTHKKASGEQIDCEVRLVRLPSRDKVLVRGSITDTTERRRTNLQLREWQKFDALGKLAGGIAHDFNNVLAVIASAAQIIEMESTEEQTRADASIVVRAAGRGMDLTSQLLNFARRHAPPFEIIDLNDVVREIVKAMRRVMDTVSLECDLSPASLHVSVSRSHLDQVVLNLIINARDAIEGAGRILIRTEDQARHAWLYVTDDGRGMSEDVKRDASKPFFTTKELAGGSGLGLSVVNDIVTEAQGTLEITSAPGKGTTVAVGFRKVDYMGIS